MSLMERLNEDMKQAMKNKDKETLSVIRMLKAAIQNEMIKLGKDTLSEEEELTILSRELKQRNDSLHEFKAAKRDDLIQKVEKEITIVKNYMPEPLSEEELAEFVKQAIEQVNATSKKDIGKVMGILMPKVKGKADGSVIKDMVMQQLK
ncbi:hypothetical protein GCM10010978_01000 [Compostibacillus humi]|uniref:GatB/YqeY domain-containing protein n=1 Tax=Compostibacillus humi TaxID=1245525 RepID=A0A8J3EI77_9BACI|nr:GatB/YqeY domain-containing protein [Compostibacillus humi]GGH68230.1 hypothetical protein GCM10010978_01000 [Compostibacillus humi]HLT56684.1 GatB/YqeY domain-containing protein [Bacillota bacterium]